MQALAVQLQLDTHECLCIRNYHSSYMYSILDSGAVKFSRKRYSSEETTKQLQGNTQNSLQGNTYILLPGLVGNMARYCTSVYKYFPEP